MGQECSKQFLFEGLLLDFWNSREVSYALKFCELHEGNNHYIPQIIILTGTQ